jgi:hypothetical protein
MEEGRRGRIERRGRRREVRTKEGASKRKREQGSGLWHDDGEKGWREDEYVALWCSRQDKKSSSEWLGGDGLEQLLANSGGKWEDSLCIIYSNNAYKHGDMYRTLYP